jgi:hypothetical protein
MRLARTSSPPNTSLRPPPTPPTLPPIVAVLHRPLLPTNTADAQNNNISESIYNAQCLQTEQRRYILKMQTLATSSPERFQKPAEVFDLATRCSARAASVMFSGCSAEQRIAPYGPLVQGVFDVPGSRHMLLTGLDLARIWSRRRFSELTEA